MPTKSADPARHSNIRLSLLCSAMMAAFALYAADGMRPAGAQSVTSSGNLNFTPPGGASHWSVGDDLVVGDTANGSLTIDAGGTVDNNWGYVGNHNGAAGTLTVQGTDGGGNASGWTSSGQVLIGVEAGSSGTLNILDGGVATSNAGVVIGNDNGSVGNALVSGAGSTWNSSVANSFQIGAGGSGTLEINAGGVVHSGQGVLGFDSTGDGHVTVSGPGSIWDPIGNIYVGLGGAGELNVLDGAAVSTVGPGGPASAAAIYIGYNPGSQGTVNVSSSTGDISTLSATDYIDVGSEGDGTLNIGKGGFASAGTDVYIARSGAAAGTLNLTGDATGRGILETGSVVKGAGAGPLVLNLDGGILRANRDEPDFLNGFTTLDINTAGGAWFDTNGHDIGIATGFSGGSSLNKLGSGTLTLTGDSSAFTGNTEVQAGTLQVDGTLGGPTNVWANARLTGIGQVGPTTNLGVIAPGHAGTLGTLTIAGDYTPSGGSLAIRTRLGDDSSPTDRLVVTGSTLAGATPLKVTNVGGAGAQTTEGIKIIDVAGASNGTFTLQGTTSYQGDPAIVAGAYAYRLFQGGASTPADGDWYLRSALTGASAPSSTPLYQPGVPTYEAYPQFLLGLNGVPTLQQRVGNRYWNNGNDPATDTNGLWVRVEGGHNQIDPGHSTSGTGYDYDMTKAQFGLDALLAQNDNGTLVGGLSTHYVHGRANTDWRYGAGGYGDGNISTNGHGVGATLTWYGANGFYVDGTAQATWYDSSISANPVHGLESGNNAFGSAFSIETGKRIAIDSNWSVTPQAQLVYSKARFKDFHDVFGASVTPGRDDSLQARASLSLERQVDRTHLYAIASVYNELLDGTSVEVGGQEFGSRNDRLWAEVGVGGSYNWSKDKYSVYGAAAVKTSLADSGSHGYGGTVGVRIRW